MSLPAWLSSPGLQPLWEVVHERLEQRGPEWRGRASLDVASVEQRRAMASLLGRSLDAGRVTVDVADLDQRTANAGGIVAVVEHAVGPVRDRRSAREVARAVREAPVVAAVDVVAGQPWAEEWLRVVRRTGPTPHEAVLAARLLGRLLAGQERLARQDLAAGVTGDAHALDDGTVLSSLVLRGLALALGAPPPEGAGARRELWEAAGVALDGVSSTCLVLALPVLRGRLARRLEDGQPLHLTARDLREDLTVPSATTVLVCENPRVLEAVADSGLAVPVVCANGNPNLLVMDLLAALRRCDARLLYHGDFDWPGLAIANRLVTAVEVEPWHMGAADYEAAASGSQLGLRGEPVEARWDADLAPAMAAVGRAVHEEAVIPALLGVLSGS